jgi:hypothetical protein
MQTSLPSASAIAQNARAPASGQQRSAGGERGLDAMGRLIVRYRDVEVDIPY